ncbi:MMPL family transporter [Streptomyces sp. NPDC046876]|uniref:MMPL family transporter n=1 Tax=Streptomyces sp. NPDC046876 TaxID=3155616 RepID=UPI0034053C99
MHPRKNIAATVGRWSARHRWSAVLLWLLFTALAVTAGSSTELVGLSAAEQVNGEAQRAQQILQRAGLELPAQESVYVHSDTLTADSPAFAAVVGEVAQALGGAADVSGVAPPLGPQGTGAVSADRHSALVTFRIGGDPTTAKERVQPSLEATAKVAGAHRDLTVEQFGEASFAKAYTEKLEKDYSSAETLSFPVTLAILFVAFGALVAATLPVLLALTALVAAGGAAALASHVVHIDANGTSVMGLVGIAVGVDYSLFYVRRVREERARGVAALDAVEIAAATSGRAVVVSGLAVIASLAGMFLTNNGIQSGMAMATIIVVSIAVLGSVTVLPAVLSLLGDRVNKGRIPFLQRRKGGAGVGAGAGESGRGVARVLKAVLARPLVSVLVVGGALAALCAPAFAIRLLDPGLADLPAQKLPVLRTYERIQASFPGASAPAGVVVKAADVTDPKVTAAIEELRTAASAAGAPLRGPVSVENSADRTVARVTVGLLGNGTDEASVDSLRALRTEVLPRTLGTVAGVETAVGGATAASVDTGNHLSDSTPGVVAFVLALTFVLMLVSFRSVTIAALTLVLNLLSVGAAYGLVVAVFQWGFASDLLDFTSTDGITSWVPLFLFVILFGLSMDYHVLVVSRIRELRDGGAATDRAISDGVRQTAGAVTSAAVVMVAVAAVFTTMPEVSMKEAGLGLSAAVLIDALVIRTVLLPASLRLLGDRSWYLPGWLGWLPQPRPHGEAGSYGPPSGAESGGGDDGAVDGRERAPLSAV